PPRALEALNCGKPHAVTEDDVASTIDAFRFMAGGRFFRVRRWAESTHRGSFISLPAPLPHRALRSCCYRALYPQLRRARWTGPRGAGPPGDGPPGAGPRRTGPGDGAPPWSHGSSVGRWWCSARDRHRLAGARGLLGGGDHADGAQAHLPGGFHGL